MLSTQPKPVASDADREINSSDERNLGETADKEVNGASLDNFD